MIQNIQCDNQPLTLMGNVASRCWASTPSKQIGIDCIESNHGRILEYPSVTVEISEYSAKMIRELYTHIVGVTRVQASTRYIDYNNFDYYIPESIQKNNKISIEYRYIMNEIMKSYKYFIENKIPKEDAANMLPLGMMTKVILKINLRAILHMNNIRSCKRALKEFRNFVEEFNLFLSNIDDEWEYIIKNYAKPKCEIIGYCDEKYSCGKQPSKKEFLSGKLNWANIMEKRGD